MLVRKVCMIGDFAVGKTSLVRRFVHSIFSEKYLTTIGVKIDTRELDLIAGEVIKLVLWDIAGTDALSTVEKNYLRGSAAYVLVVDGTRHETLTAALQLDQSARRLLGSLPRILLLNKHDLLADWELSGETIEGLRHPQRPLFLCSARNGEAVDEAFRCLAQQLTGN